MLILLLLYLAMAGVFWSMLANVTMEGFRSGVAALLWPLTLAAITFDILVIYFRKLSQ